MAFRYQRHRLCHPVTVVFDASSLLLVSPQILSLTLKPSTWFLGSQNPGSNAVAVFSPMRVPQNRVNTIDSVPMWSLDSKAIGSASTAMLTLTWISHLWVPTLDTDPHISQLTLLLDPNAAGSAIVALLSMMQVRSPHLKFHHFHGRCKHGFCVLTLPALPPQCCL